MDVLAQPARDQSRQEESRFPFLALVEHTNWMDKAITRRSPDLLRRLRPANHEYFRMNEDELTERFVETLPTFNRDLSRVDSQTWVFRAPYAQPIPTATRASASRAGTPLPGVYWRA